MLTPRRKQFILDRLKRDGQIIATQLSEELGISEDTIRRDLRELAAEGALRRVHGGALPIAAAEADFARRREIAVPGKALIGRHAAAMIQPGQIVMLDGGTTAIQVARHLPADLACTVVTHSPSIAVELAAHPSVEVILIGGRLFKHSVVSVGATAEEMIKRIRADLFFMGITGVHAEAGLTTGDFEEAAIKQRLSQQAVETHVLASAEKIGVASPFLIAELSSITSVLTDQHPQHAAVRAIANAGVSITALGLTVSAAVHGVSSENDLDGTNTSTPVA